MNQYTLLLNPQRIERQRNKQKDIETIDNPNERHAATQANQVMKGFKVLRSGSVDIFQSKY
jgi:hypothetical protein